jgi:hypothetical protein
MNSPSGCFKPAMYGCLGLLGLLVLLALVTMTVAWNNVSKQDVVEQQSTAPVAGRMATDEAPSGTAEPALQPIRKAPGRVVLDLGQGEFFVRPAAPGEGLTIEARYDKQTCELVESFEVLPDSTWVYRVQYRRTISALQAIAQSILGGETPSRVTVSLPPEVPLDLVLSIRQGGGEIDLGGLWLREVSIECHQGGLAADFSSPLREPVRQLALRSRMGGISVSRVGNASPLDLSIDTSMGGGDVDLSGQWRNDCRGRFSVSMGGMSVSIPEALTVRDLAEIGDQPLAEAVETRAPTIWVETSASRGEIEVERR